MRPLWSLGKSHFEVENDTITELSNDGLFESQNFRISLQQSGSG